uniref:Acyl transferase domain-containing protein n=1 Tax=Candidatus Kentrum sp. UNK TaxID=2126344 RepID=A0A451AJZ2_9GAMM|nr:MAG: Acyl transferase domain-containing protein [Candidatus Kentron sp. UNK]
MQTDELSGIAILGMAGRFPEAADLDAFWRMLITERAAFRPLGDDELRAAGVSQDLIDNPNYVKSDLMVPDVDRFDAGFFGMNPRDAALTDPQHRLFMECAYEALEQAGYPGASTTRAGVYAGVGKNSYFEHYLHPRQGELLVAVGPYRLDIMNRADFVATGLAYKLGLTGPAITVQTACSTSLTAVHLACQGLLDFDCDLALAGGASLDLPQGRGYLYQTGGIASPDGRCRAFAADANGTVFGGGVGVVALKRLADAVADRDTILAVIRGSAINNDGSDKIGFTAPSVGGQTQVIVEALAAAEIEPDAIDVIEAHGTGTPLGDPIELQALTRAFRAGTNRVGYCAIGSVKTNIGHGDAAAGIAGLIKIVLALKNEILPASLYAEHTNPHIDFANSPFFVNTTTRPWTASPKRARIAGVSSFGIGGTNAHVIVAEAPPPAPEEPPAREVELLLLSARTETALDRRCTRLAEHLRDRPRQSLADIAYTLARGRAGFRQRRMLVCRDVADAERQLRASGRLPGAVASENPPAIALLFPGQGAQYAGMTRGLYAREEVFRNTVDHCAAILGDVMGLDIRQVLYGDGKHDLRQTALTQPTLFVAEYALATLWRHWGIRPAALLGHSVGEYVAACLAGVFPLEDALGLIATRGRLIQSLPPGAMLAVALSEQEAAQWCTGDISLAVVNGSRRCVLSGPRAAIEALATDLARHGVDNRPLATSHAYHSSMLDPILDDFTAHLASIRFEAPSQPLLSNLTGDWIGPDQATDPNYWTRHLRGTVRFADNLRQLYAQEIDLLLECGPGAILSGLATEHPDRPQGCVSIPTLPRDQDTSPAAECASLRHGLGQLWLRGAHIDWDKVYQGEMRRRAPLPTYPFERQRCWIEPAGQTPAVDVSASWWAGWLDEIRALAGAHPPSLSINDAKEGLDTLCVLLMSRTLRQLGAFGDPRRAYRLEQIAGDCGIIEPYRQLIGDWLRFISKAGRLQHQADHYSDLRECSEDELLQASTRVSRIAPIAGYLQPDRILDLSRHLGDFLRGAVNPRELLAKYWAPDEDGPSPAESRCAELIRNSVERLIARLPASANLRILEIGGGTGIATAELLPSLPATRTRYWFTDVGRFFLRQAEQRFSAYDFIRYRRLNMDESPRTQGFAEGEIDLIIAVNALHIGGDIGRVLGNLLALLAPGGLLMLWEIIEPRADFCVYDAFLMPPVSDGERTMGVPFLSVASWRSALQRAGFTDIETLPETADAPGQTLIIARRSTEIGAVPAFAAPPDGLQDDGAPEFAIKPVIEPSIDQADPAPSGSDTEQAIADIWRQCLGIDGIGPESRFLDLGGDSLTAVQVVSRMNQTLATDMTVNDLLANPSVATLANALTAQTNSTETAPRKGAAICLQTGAADCAPLFLIHPAGGNLFIYQDLVARIDDQTPLYGFAASGLRDESRVRISVEEMATEYLTDLRRLQPGGPYYLAGASSGGLVAFEMAQRLHASGQAVALLGLLDTPIGWDMPEILLSRQVIVEYFADIFSGGDALRRRLPVDQGHDEQVAFLYQELRSANQLSEAMDLGQWRRLVDVFAANVEARAHLPAQTLSGAVGLCARQDPPSALRSPIPGTAMDRACRTRKPGPRYLRRSSIDVPSAARGPAYQAVDPWRNFASGVSRRHRWLSLKRCDQSVIVTFPENPEQNDQKIRESKEVVFHRPFWFRIFRVGM